MKSYRKNKTARKQKNRGGAGLVNKFRNTVKATREKNDITTKVVYKPENNEQLKKDIEELKKIYSEYTNSTKENKEDVWDKGLIGDWDVSHITDMSYLFFEFSNFNENINNWNVSSVTNMKSMFFGCEAFNQPLNSWNVSKVTNMEGMFDNCEKFNQPLDNWNVSNVNNMNGMFHNAIAFNHPLNKWRVSNKTDMIGMFKNAKNFNDPKILESWNLKPKYEYKGHKKEMFTHADAMQDYLKSVFLGGRRKTRKRRHI